MKNYKDKDFDTINADVEEEFNKIDIKGIRDDQEIYKAGMNIIDKYINELLNSDKLVKKERYIMKDGKPVLFTYQNDYWHTAKKYFTKALNKFRNKYNTVKGWTILGWNSGVHLTTSSENAVLIRQVASVIEVAEFETLSKIEEYCNPMQEQDNALYNSSVKKDVNGSPIVKNGEIETQKPIFTHDSAGLITFTDISNNLSFVDVVNNNFGLFNDSRQGGYPQYTIDYENCKNQKLKNKMENLTRGLDGTLRYDASQKKYFIKGCNGIEIDVLSVGIWEGVTLKRKDLEYSGIRRESRLSRKFGKIDLKGKNIKDVLLSEIKSNQNLSRIPDYIINEYFEFIKDEISEKDGFEERLQTKLGLSGNIFKDIEVNYLNGSILFYVKKLCPNKYEDILRLLVFLFGENFSVFNDTTDLNIIRIIINFIKRYGENTSYRCLKYCSPFEGSYLKNGLGAELSYFSMAVQFYENFVIEPESLNLITFLISNPQKLSNLGGMKIKEIDLNINTGINFAFRGILEMVKSRPDINFPHLNKNASKLEKAEWKHQREKIIKEYENMLRNYISKDFETNNNGEKIQRLKNKTFDKIFYTRPYGDHVIDDSNSESILRDFTQNEISKYSFNTEPFQIEDLFRKNKSVNEETRQISMKLLSDIESYVKDHPNDRILICIDQHGQLDGSSCNGWNKEDWIKVANLSPNVKIWSIRCFFGAAYDNENIYSYKSSLSGFSNKTATNSYVIDGIDYANDIGLGFHEMEIYTRLNYFISVSPLTENMKYIDWNSGKTKVGKVGLAQNDTNESDNIDNFYA